MPRPGRHDLPFGATWGAGIHRALALACLLVMGCGGAPNPSPATPTTSPEPAASEPLASAATPTVEASPPDPPLSPTPQLALGAAFSCMLRASGEVLCWGSNRFAQLGDPSLEADLRSRRAEPKKVVGLADAVAIAAGSWHACALRADRTVVCWGHGGFGQLGVGAKSDSTTPTAVASLGGARAIAAGEAHSCAIKGDGSVVCWGRNDRLQLGVEGVAECLEPCAVPSISDARALACGRAHCCVLAPDPAAKDSSLVPFCWGENVDGQLGDGSRSSPEGHRLPAVVELDSPKREGRTKAPSDPTAKPAPTAVVAGMGASCVLSESAPPLCWGRNDSAQLGLEGGNARDAQPRPSPLGTSRATSLALGARHSCFATGEGQVSCLGLNHRGQLGDGSRTLRQAPTTVKGVRGALDLAAGVAHSCALLQGGDVLCWGDNREHQLGRPTPAFSNEALVVPFDLRPDPTRVKPP